MKDARFWVMMTLVAAVLTSCGGKQKHQTSWVESEHEAVVRRMPDLSVTDSLQAGGHVYRYEIVRVASDSLPKVRDDMDDFYADNTIRLTLQRDGRTYFDHTFTKATFAQNLDETFLGNSILDGIRFLGAEPGRGLTFSFAVSYPDSDMSVPFLLTVAENGTFSFIKDENLDVEEGDSVYLTDEGV